MTNLPAGLTPRLLTTRQVAEYLGFGNVKSIAKPVKSGAISGSVSRNEEMGSIRHRRRAQ